MTCTQYKTMWEFKTAQFIIRWDIYPSENPDLSWDDTGEVSEKLNTGEYLAFDSRLQVIHRASGLELGADYLGASIYSDPKDFRDHFGCRPKGYGSYFSDMVRTAIDSAREQLNTLTGVHMRAAH